jgi:hypothetical protein
MLNHSVKEALEGERDHLLKYVRKAQDKIAAIDALLESDDTLPLFSQAVEPVTVSGNGSGSLAGKGLVEGMFLVLGSYPSGLLRNDLEEKLLAKGLKVGGKMPFRTRLRAEISRQKRFGKLISRGKKVLLKPKEGLQES